MKISEQQIKNIEVIKLDGNLMGGPEAVSLNEKINHYLDEKKLKLVINLGSVERVNSSGLGILIKALHNYKSNGGELKLACVTPTLNKLLHITKLDTIFESYETVDAALNSF